MARMAGAVLSAVFLQLLLNADFAVTQSPVAGQTSPFEIPDTLILTYSTPSQRNVILQQILVIWRNALNDYQSSNVAVKFVSETTATTTGTRTNSQATSGRRMQVTYHITGQSVLPVDVNQATTTFRQTLQDAHVTGAELMTTDASSTSGQDSTTQQFSTTETVTLTYTTVKQRETFLQQILTIWRNALTAYSATNVQITFVSERSSQQTSSTITTSKTVTYRVTATTTVTVDTESVKATVRQTIQDAHLTGMQATSSTGTTQTDTQDQGTDDTQSAVDDNATTATTVATDDTAGDDDSATTASGTSDDSAADTTEATNIDTSSTSDATATDATSDQTITDTLPLAYATTTERDRSMEWIRRLWAYVLNVQVRNVQVKVTQDTLIPASFLGTLQTRTQGHNVTYTVIVTTTVANFNADILRTTFQQLLPASTTSYLVTFPAGNVPASVNITIIDQIRGPQNTKDTDQQNLQTFIIYDTISFSYTTTQERNKILEIIRRSWEQALGRGAVTVDLMIHQDTPKTDGTHQITYLVNVLSQRNEWNIQQLERKFRQVLTNANIPSLVMPDVNSMGSFTTPTTDNGVRSFVFYDDITLTYTTESQRTAALESIRKTWQHVLGVNAWNVRVSVYQDTASDVTHQISYTIMFSSQNQTEWDFNTLATQFHNQLTTIKGTGFSAALAEDRSSGSDSVLFRAHHLITNNGKPGQANHDSEHSGAHHGSINNGNQHHDSDHRDDNHGHHGTHGHSNGHRGSVMDSGDSMDSGTVFNYFLSDGIKLEYSKMSDRELALEAIRQAWIMLLGTKASDVQISMNSDFQSTTSSRHNIHYHLMIVSSVAHFEMDLEAIRSKFWSTISMSSNALLKKAQHLLVLPFITGNLDSIPQAKQDAAASKASSSSNDYQSASKKIQSPASETSSNDEDRTDDSSDSSSQAQQWFAFTLEDTRLISYTSDADLDKAIQQLKDLWITVIGGVDSVEDVNVRITSNVMSMGAHSVSYKVTGSSKTQVVRSDALALFLQALARARFSFIAQPQRGWSSKSTMTAQSSQNQSQSSSSSSHRENHHIASSSRSVTTTQLSTAANAAGSEESSKIFFLKSLQQTGHGSQKASDSSSSDDQNASDDEDSSDEAAGQETTPADVDDSLDSDGQQSDDSSDASSKQTKSQQTSYASQIKSGSQSTKATTRKAAPSKASSAAASSSDASSNGAASASNSEDSESSDSAISSGNSSSKTMATGSQSNRRRDHEHDQGRKKEPVEIHGSITIRYRNKKQREDALTEIRRRWIRADVLDDVDDIIITFDKEVFPQWAQVGPDSFVHELTYTITGRTRRRHFDEHHARRELNDVLIRAHLPFLVSRQTAGGQGDDEAESFDSFRNPDSDGEQFSDRSLPVGGRSRNNASLTQVNHQMNAYIIHDSFRITADNDDERISYLDKLENIWQQIFGNNTELVETAVYEDHILSGENFKTHDVKYAVIIVSNSHVLDLQAAKLQFAKLKPAPKIALIAPEPAMTSPPSNAVVLLQSIPLSYSSDMERDNFVTGIEQLWQLALGKGVQLVQVWLYDEATIDTTISTSDSAKTTTTSELSYAVLVVSQADILDISALKLQLEQYLLTKMVAVNQAGNSTACASRQTHLETSQ